MSKKSKSKRGRPIYWVDIPTVAAITSPGTNDFENVANFRSLRAARRFVKDHFGGDGKGNVQLITEGEQ